VLGLKKLISRFFDARGYVLTKKLPPAVRNDVISLQAKNNNRGNALLAYVIDPFLVNSPGDIPNTHTHFAESLAMAEAMLEMGYAVDVIDYRNPNFIPQKEYAIFLSARSHMQRIAERLNSDCKKIVHLDTAHWLFNNAAAYNRMLDLQKRKGATTNSIKWVAPNWAIECADYATVLGNNFTLSTYEFAQKPLYRLYVPAITTYPQHDNKNFKQYRNRFLWLGSEGLVHKGLDLVLEAFVEMPNMHLTVCGPIENDQKFCETYHKELYEQPNIKTIGWIDVTGQEFADLTSRCVALIYPSASEGQAGAVVTCLHAGLIPIVSYQSGVDVEDFGIVLKDNSIDTIKKAVEETAGRLSSELSAMSQKAWAAARKNYVAAAYKERLKQIIKEVLGSN
jgi:glycosyltransferase involved in cell wall biosynthesis